MRLQALIMQRIVGTFAAARFLRHNGASLEDAVAILARRTKQ